MWLLTNPSTALVLVSSMGQGMPHIVAEFRALSVLWLSWSWSWAHYEGVASKDSYLVRALVHCALMGVGL